MGDKMRLIPFDQLIEWVLEENKNEKSIFGVPNEKFFKASTDNNLCLAGSIIENPLGPAAGPNTQLAQNIIAAYVAGGRFFELKTVQILDGEDLPVSKPCILAEDEGYNVEWSTELTVPDAFNEYGKAWFALNILAKELSLGSNNGFMFNMSVGYDLEGIQSPKIDTFINGMKDASGTAVWKECKSWLLHNIGKFKTIDKRFIEEISPVICTSVTLSTLHGCPPQEIERIAKHLMGEKKLHTYVKCNPTLLGYEFARDTLDKMGYGTIKFDDYHFKNDLQFSDAVPMFERLMAFASERDLTFGVKLSNTLPVKIENNELPGDEMYMSGRALYPMTINLAYKLSKAFDGSIRISYSGGADFFNIDRIYRTGIWPITLATNLLKPGGYSRLKQLADLLETAYEGSSFSGVNLERLKLLAESSISDFNYLKERRGAYTRKLKKKVPLTDCFIAPCTEGCPIGQDIPEYIRLAGEKRTLEALEVITSKNPLPFITGTLCNHPCMSKCARLDCDEAVRIRDVKLLAAESSFVELLEKLEIPVTTSDYKVAVIGGGPAGLSAAYFLAQSGVDVTVFEKRNELGGVMRHAAPDFRISREAIDHDMDLIRKTGVKFCLGAEENFSVKELRSQGFKYIFIAIGAWKPGNLKLDPCDRKPVNVLEILEAYKNRKGIDHGDGSFDQILKHSHGDSFPDQILKPGKTVVIVGAGNSAIDAARSAKRLQGVENVCIVYRRTKEYMPADKEELNLALKEGVEFKELLSPVAYSNRILKCQRMVLGAPDSSGRRSPVAVEGEFVDIEADTIIAAVGEQVETELFIQNGFELDSKDRVAVNPETNETSISGVYIGGDALRGPATIVEGISDGRKFADRILEKENARIIKQEKTIPINCEKQIEEIRNKNLPSSSLDRTLLLRNKKGVLRNASEPAQESFRCLECNTLCNICVEVCPNRANLAVNVSSAHVRCKNQIIHLDGMCNECGNCRTFCPYDSAPYKDKLTLYWYRQDFFDDKNPGFYLADKAETRMPLTDPIRFLVRLNGEMTDVSFDRNGICSGNIPKEIEDLIWTSYRDYSYVFVHS